MKVRVRTVVWVAALAGLLSLAADRAFPQATTINGQRTVSSALTVNGETTLAGTTKTVNFEASLPATCTAPSGSTPGELVFRTSDNTLHACTATNTFTQIGGGSGSADWSLTDSWEFSVDGTTASPIDFTSLGTLTDILVVAQGLTTSASGIRALQVSTDGGSTFRSTSGDYVTLGNNAETARTALATSGDTSGTGARGFIATILGAGVNGGYKANTSSLAQESGQRIFVQSTSPINALRVENVSGGGNFTGGKIFVFTR